MANKKTARRGGASSAKKKNDPNIDRLEAIVKILEKSTLSEIEFEDEDIAVRVVRGGGGGGSVVVSAPVAAPTPAPTPAPAAEPAAAPAAADDPNVFVVKSPFVGTFYSAPSPDDPSFVEVGSDVSKGQTLCIVEAMKLMNEIECEVSGTVQEILVENGKAVQYGEPLFKITKK